MKKLMLTLLAICLLATPLAAQENPDKGPGSQNVVTGAGVAIPDDGYDGTQASMGCLTVPGADLVVEDVTVDLAVNHTWIGDLTVKVWSPSGTVLTLLSRPAFAEVGDDGTGCCGDSSDLVETSPINFTDASANSAEAMGVGTVVCQDDGICDFFPFPDSGPGIAFSDFAGEIGTGDWTICAGDSAGGDVGEIIPTGTGVNITGTPLATVTEVPTLGFGGMTVLLLALAFAGLLFLRRK